MAATILAKDVLRRVSVQLTDAPNSAGQFTRWTERELVDWLNDGQRVIAKYLPASCARVDAIKLKPGTRQSIETIPAASVLPGDGSTPSDVRGKQLLDVIRGMGANGTTPGRAIRVSARDVLDAAAPDWHTRSSVVITDYVYDPRTPNVFWVYPGAPSAGTLWVELAYLANPNEVPYSADTMRLDGASTVRISIDDQYVDDLVNYILARAHLKEAEVAGNAAIAGAHVNMFVASINAQAAAMTGTNPNLKMLPMSPAVPAAAS